MYNYVNLIKHAKKIGKQPPLKLKSGQIQSVDGSSPVSGVPGPGGPKNGKTQQKRQTNKKQQQQQIKKTNMQQRKNKKKST